MTSRVRSTSKKRLSSLFSRSGTPSVDNPAQPKRMDRFLHLKFASGRPPPLAAAVPWAHEVDPARDPLHETLKSDVQREGVVRYLQQNFPAGTYVHDVVHEREADAGMFVLCTKNWARSVGDPKLHLSLYVYQEDSHCATWHAYTDRSISYSRDGDEADPPPEGADPYSTPEALAAAASRAPSPLPPPQDDDRPRFDRPAAAPDSDADGAEEPFQPSELLSPRATAGETGERAAAGRSRRSPAPRHADPVDESEEEEAPPRKSRSAVVEDEAEPPAPSAPAAQRGSRSSRRRDPSLDEGSEHGEEDVDLSKPAYPILKSKPLGHRSSRAAEPSPSPSPSPPPAQTRLSRSARRERSRSRSPTPEPPKRDRKPRSPSPSRSPSPPPRSSRRAEPTEDRARERSRRRPPKEEERAASPASRSPSPPPKKPAPSRSSRRARSPSPAAKDGRARSESPPPRHGRRSVVHALEDQAEHVKEKVAHRKPRGRSASRSPSPPPKRPASRSSRAHRPADEEAKKASSHRARSASRSLSPPPAREAARRSRSSPPRDRRLSDDEDDKPAPTSERRGRSSARPAPPAAPAPSAPPLERTPSWRSVSRNRHRRDSSDDDTLVRGNLDDHELDIPAGGEVSLLEAKRRSASKDRAARRPRVRDEGFDPAVVGKPPPAPPKQTAKDVLGGWIKSVGALLKTEEELVVGEVKEKVLEAEVEMDETRLKRKEERKKRREARAARRAARAEAEEQLYAAEASEARAERKRLEHAEEERKRKDREGKARIAAEEAARQAKSAPVKEDRHRDDRARASSRRRAASPSASEDEHTRPAPLRSARRAEPVETDRSRVRSSRHRHHGSSNVDSPSELDEEPESARPPPRQRAMSISATVESGLKGLRDSVAKIVSSAHEVEHEAEAKVHRSSAPREQSSRRKVDSDSEEEQERAMEQARRTMSRRPSVVETDGEGHRGSRRQKPSAPPAPSAPSRRNRDDEDAHRCSHSSRSHRQQSTIADDSELSDVPPSRSARESRRAPVERSDSEDSSVPPPRRHAQAPISSDTDASEALSRPSSRLTVRSESEGDTPVHRLAKLNAAFNSTATPVDPPRPSRDEHLFKGVRSVPASPALSRGHALPSPQLQHPEHKPRHKGRHLVDELRHDVDGFEHKVDKLARHKIPQQQHAHHQHGHGREGGFRPRTSSVSSEEEGSYRASPRSPPADHRRPALHAPPSHGYPTIPPIPSPISPSAPPYPYAYSASQAPLRPQPLKPAPYSAPVQQQQARRVPPPSSVGSSNEGDPSRAPSGALRRARSGFLTGSEGESDRFDRSRSPSPPPASAPAPAGMNKRHSFSRTGGSYPFSAGESSDELSPSSDEGEHDDDPRFGGFSSRTRVSAPPARAQVREEEPYRVPPGGSRTMVSAPGLAPRGGGRTTVSSSPALSSPSAGGFRLSPSQLLEREGPSGFTGFDVRGSEREARDAQFERDERERDQRERRERARLMALGRESGSAMRYGTYGAPVGRRMARQLGL
ncbi:hypothetical protein JCM10450v2_001489 [Rhodotorula kratochvilovae]